MKDKKESTDSFSEAVPFLRSSSKSPTPMHQQQKKENKKEKHATHLLLDLNKEKHIKARNEYNKHLNLLFQIHWDNFSAGFAQGRLLDWASDRIVKQIKRKTENAAIAHLLGLGRRLINTSRTASTSSTRTLCA